MARYYLEIAGEPEASGRRSILAVCLQELEPTASPRPAQVFTRWDWGEREIVKVLLDRGALDPSSGFSAVGPHVREDLELLLERAEVLRVARVNRVSLAKLWSATGTDRPAAVNSLPEDRFLELYRAGKYDEAAQSLLRRSKPDPTARARD